MDKPKIEIKYIENHVGGYLNIVINGLICPSIRMDFETGNSATIHQGLSKLLERVYVTAYKHGERASKQKVCDFLDWAYSQ